MPLNRRTVCPRRAQNVLSKVLEAGTYVWPQCKDQNQHELTKIKSFAKNQASRMFNNNQVLWLR